MSGWQPIDTAPKDGTDILVFSWMLGHLVVCYDESASVQGADFPWATLDGPSYFRDAPSYWMPLPEPPQEEVA